MEKLNSNTTQIITEPMTSEESSNEVKIHADGLNLNPSEIYALFIKRDGRYQ